MPTDDVPSHDAAPPAAVPPAAPIATPTETPPTSVPPVAATRTARTAKRTRVTDRPARAPAGELLSAVSALALLVLMFVAKWYGVDALPHSAERSGIQSASSAWNQLSDVRWMMFLTVLVAFGSVVIHVTQRSHGSQTDMSRLVTAVAGITSLLLVYRVAIELPSPQSVVDAKVGAYLGLLATVGVALGGYESSRAQRLARRRPAQRPPRRTARTAATRAVD